MSTNILQILNMNMRIPSTIMRLVACLAIMAASFAAQARTPGSNVGVTFDRTEADFGTVIAAAGTVHMKFTMTNNGSGAVAILSARASCGCTEPSFPRKPVAPGEEAVVNVGFNTTGQRGEIDKEVTLRLRAANGRSEKVQLRIRGVVVPE